MATKSKKSRQLYEVVSATSILELVKLVNLKTKNGWQCIGGVCYSGNEEHFINNDKTIIYYPFSQALVKEIITSK